MTCLHRHSVSLFCSFGILFQNLTNIVKLSEVLFFPEKNAIKDKSLFLRFLFNLKCMQQYFYLEEDAKTKL
jgi:hypothetical protein